MCRPVFRNLFHRPEYDRAGQWQRSKCGFQVRHTTRQALDAGGGGVDDRLHGMSRRRGQRIDALGIQAGDFTLRSDEIVTQLFAQARTVACDQSVPAGIHAADDAVAPAAADADQGLGGLAAGLQSVIGGG